MSLFHTSWTWPIRQLLSCLCTILGREISRQAVSVCKGYASSPVVSQVRWSGTKGDLSYATSCCWRTDACADFPWGWCVIFLFGVIVVHVLWDSDPIDMCVPHSIDPALEREVFWDLKRLGSLASIWIWFWCVLRATVFASVDCLRTCLCVFFKGVHLRGVTVLWLRVHSKERERALKILEIWFRLCDQLLVSY